MHATEQQPAADYHQSDLEDALRSHGYRSVTVVDTVGSTNTWLSERVAPRAGDQGRGNGPRPWSPVSRARAGGGWAVAGSRPRAPR